MGMIIAADIVALLHNRHPGDDWISVPECKIGSTWFKTNCQRFDFWTMAKSYANPRFIGYEIKVARQDFLRDTKWPGYLDYCTEFFFVAPPGIIDPNEVPEQAGLVVCTKNCKRLLIKKKTPVRDVSVPDSIYHYILMSRTQVVDEHRRDRSLEWARWLEMKDDKSRVGYQVAWEIRRRVNAKVEDVMAENKRLKVENKRLASAKATLARLGFDDREICRGFCFNGERLEKAVSEAMTGIPGDLITYAKTAAANLEAIAKRLEAKMPRNSRPV